jgi:hypothetical protein
MIINHLSVNTTAFEASQLRDVLFFVGGLAPVVFFFLTGLGYGVQSVAPNKSRRHGYLVKVALLLLADALSWIRPGQYLGNDFLGFIGISMLVLEWIRRVPRSIPLAAAMGFLVIALRFGLGPVLRDQLDPSGSFSWAGFLLGTLPLDGFSYPPCPWLFYPLSGYVLGRLAASHRQSMSSLWTPILSVLLLFACLSLGIAAAVLARGAILFRFGTMSVGFFSASLAAISISLILALAACGAGSTRSFVDVVSLTGIRSLSVVPLHYLYRDVVISILGMARTCNAYVAMIVVGVMACFSASAMIPWMATRLQSSGRSQGSKSVLWLSVMIGAWALWTGSVAEPYESALRSLCQLCVCLLFALSYGFNSPVAKPSVPPQR